MCVSSVTFEDSYKVSNSQFLASVDTSELSVPAGQFERRRWNAPIVLLQVAWMLP